MQELVSVLQVMPAASERAMKPKVHVIKSLSPYSTKLYQKNINCLLVLPLLLLLRTRNNTDGNQLVIFS